MGHLDALKNRSLIAAVASLLSMLTLTSAIGAPLAIKDSPLFMDSVAAPLNMLVMGRDHRIYYEAYNDASDLNDDGELDIRYKPDEITYFGYFDSKKCYTYGGGMFTPVGLASLPLKQCAGGPGGQWSGDWLNYVTMSRIDALRAVLYGGLRSTDTNTDTVLQRAFIPQDAHSWGKEYESVAVDGYDISRYAGVGLPSPGRRHLFANTTPSADPGVANGNPAINGLALPRMRVLIDRPNRIWEWVSKERLVAGTTIDTGGATVASNIDADYVVRVKVCVGGLEEENCKPYGSVSKPTGLLQDYGESDRMMFGLISGSYEKPHDGGVLRKAVASITDEIDPATGRFDYSLDPPGIIGTLDRFRVMGFNWDAYNCGWITNSADAAGNCSMWGNPTAEMMYEAMRYFAGADNRTGEYNSFFDAEEIALGIKRATWDSTTDPYGPGNFPRCAKPFETVISDVSPSFDSDRLPGSSFNPGWTGTSPALAGFDAASRGQFIWDQEMGPGPHPKFFIGQSGAVYDGAPTPKNVSSFGTIRGLAPEAPTKEGSYYAASVAYHGLQTDVNSGTAGDQKVQTFAVALASPLPQIKIPVGGGRFVTLVPFAKSVGGCLGVNGTQGVYQPTNQIVDFYVDTITPTYGRFRVNFEDVEQGADHDMDAIVVYEYELIAGKVQVRLSSEYAAGCIIHHVGYVISGTTQDGAYLEVRDRDTGAGADPDYFLDTPAGENPGGDWTDNVELPLSSTRDFDPGASTGATVLKDPLWYAAKWGGFKDSNANGLPDVRSEWANNTPVPVPPALDDPDPDNYFLVTNALTLKQQLGKAFQDILNRSGSASSASVNSGSISSTNSTRIYQVKFASQYWSGQVLSYPITAGGVLGLAEWDAAEMIPAANVRKIFTASSALTANVHRDAIPFRWTDLSPAQQAMLQPLDALGADRLDYLRGERSGEQINGGSFRNRSPDTVMGDIVNSSPAYVGAPSFRYQDTLEASPYSTFRTAHRNRRPMVYVGSNDGMLHAINADTPANGGGNEMFSFIPHAVQRNLIQLTDPAYPHYYYVDGTPTVIDAYFGGAWHTVLTAGLNRGGQGVFALDITNPTLINEASADSAFLWEFTDDADVDLGYTYSRPAIVKMKNGEWAAVFGNGYNNTENVGGMDTRVSSTGNAVLYVVNVETGALIRKIDTGVGMAQDPTGASRPNGLATPALVDMDNDAIIDFGYVGDLFGNLWKFDFSSPAPGLWDVAYKPSGVPTPLFVARDSLGRRQPITERPTVAFGPGSGGLVLFGTGKFLEARDRILAFLRPQSFYGIYDRMTGNAATDVVMGRGQLVEQTILTEAPQTFGSVTATVRSTSQNPVDHLVDRGWYMDLVSPTSGFQGEMQVSDPVYRNGRVIFTTIIPDTDICAYGGRSWIMEMDAMSGAQLPYPVFDVDQDGDYDTHNMLIDAIVPRPAVLADTTVEPSREIKVLPTTAGNINMMRENPGPTVYGRQSWRQIR